MNKIIVVPDSFKGTLSAKKICNIINSEVLQVFPDCQVVSIPAADGGEGTVDSFLGSVKGKKIYKEVTGPFFEKINSFYGIIDNGKTAIIEISAAAGLPMVMGNENPLETTTYGVGELIIHAIESGVKKIIIGLGGSCTNDGGCGLLAALGIKFINKNKQSFIPVGRTLGEICTIDTSNKNKKLSDIKIYAMCDVINPLYGRHGAAYVFAPQKGADEEAVKLLDKNLRIFGDLIDKEYANVKKVSKHVGAGAAGGLGAGLKALLGVPLVSGIDLLLESIHFINLIENADLIITGEGQIDGQSLDGKVVFGVAKYAKAQGIPLCVIAGQALDKQLMNAYNLGISGIFTINRRAISFSESRHFAEDNLRLTVRNILCFIKAIRSGCI